MKLKHTLLLTCLGVTTTPLGAQQPAPPPTAVEDGKLGLTPLPAARHQRENSPGKPEPKAVAYLGILTAPVPPELRAQFSLPEGFGLMVSEVMPESPAQTAGLKQYDVLLKLDDQRLVNMEQLVALVRTRKKGDAVGLSVITGGKETQVQVTLSERAAPQPERERHAQHGPGFGRGPQERAHGHQGPPTAREKGDARPEVGREHQEQMEQFRKEMREYQERLQDWTQGSRSTPMPQPPTLKTPLPGDQQHHQRSGRREHPNEQSQGARGNTRSEVHSANIITRAYESGEYTLRREDGRATFSVREKDGREQSWPVNNEDERRAVPEQHQDKLRDLEKDVRIKQDDRPPGTDDPRPMPPVAPKPQVKPTST